MVEGLNKSCPPFSTIHATTIAVWATRNVGVCEKTRKGLGGTTETVLGESLLQRGARTALLEWVDSQWPCSVAQTEIIGRLSRPVHCPMARARCGVSKAAGFVAQAQTWICCMRTAALPNPSGIADTVDSEWACLS